MQKTIRPARTAFKRALLCMALAGAGACLAQARAAGETTPLPAPAHPLTGTWHWSTFEGKCQESFQYRPDGSMHGTSGQASGQWAYTVSPQASALGFYKVVLSSVSENGNQDCSGDRLGPSGTVETIFIQFSPAKDRYIACRTESLAACFGPLLRAP